VTDFFSFCGTYEEFELMGKFELGVENGLQGGAPHMFLFEDSYLEADVTSHAMPKCPDLLVDGRR